MNDAWQITYLFRPADEMISDFIKLKCNLIATDVLRLLLHFHNSFSSTKSNYSHHQMLFARTHPLRCHTHPSLRQVTDLLGASALSS